MGAFFYAFLNQQFNDKSFFLLSSQQNLSPAKHRIAQNFGRKKSTGTRIFSDFCAFL